MTLPIDRDVNMYRADLKSFLFWVQRLLLVARVNWKSLIWAMALAKLRNEQLVVCLH